MENVYLNNKAEDPGAVLYDKAYTLFFNDQKSKKESITAKDMEEMLGVKYQTALRIIRQVKSVSNRLGIAGMIHRLDWIDYLSNKKTNLRG